MEDAGIFVLFVVIIFLAIAWIACDIMHNTEHKYWISDSEFEAIDEAIEMLVNTEIDSLIVTHPLRPSVVGYVYFREIK